MPNVHFIGDIEFASISTSDVSVTWAIVPGNTAWYLKRGISYGETHICVTSEQTGKAVISHPIDCHYDCSSTEGWPMFICEVSCFTTCNQLFTYILFRQVNHEDDEYSKYSTFCNNHSLTSLLLISAIGMG